MMYLVILGLLAIVGAMSTETSAAEPRLDESAIPMLWISDLGCEIDDQWVLVYLITHPRFDVRGILSTHYQANTARPPSSRRAALTIQHILKERLGAHSHAPVLEGASEALTTHRIPKKTQGALYLIEQAKAFDSENPLNVVIAGAATDVASAMLIDPSISQRIRVVAVAFLNDASGADYGVLNDFTAWSVILESDVPLVISTQAVTYADLGVDRAELGELMYVKGPIERWLLREYDEFPPSSFEWYREKAPAMFGVHAPENGSDHRRWSMWDLGSLAFLLGLTEHRQVPRLALDRSLQLVPGKNREHEITWITAINGPAVYASFAEVLRSYSASNMVRDHPCVTVGDHARACWRDKRRESL